MLGATELFIIGGIILLLFGGSKLAGLGKSMGQAIKGFKEGLNDDSIDVTPKKDRIENGQAQNQKTYTEEKEKERS